MLHMHFYISQTNINTLKKIMKAITYILLLSKHQGKKKWMNWIFLQLSCIIIIQISSASRFLLYGRLPQEKVFTSELHNITPHLNFICIMYATSRAPGVCVLLCLHPYVCVRTSFLHVCMYVYKSCVYMILFVCLFLLLRKNI